MTREKTQFFDRAVAFRYIVSVANSYLRSICSLYGNGR